MRASVGRGSRWADQSRAIRPAANAASKNAGRVRAAAHVRERQARACVLPSLAVLADPTSPSTRSSTACVWWETPRWRWRVCLGDPGGEDRPAAERDRSVRGGARRGRRDRAVCRSRRCRADRAHRDVALVPFAHASPDQTETHSASPPSRRRRRRPLRRGPGPQLPARCRRARRQRSALELHVDDPKDGERGAHGREGPRIASPIRFPFSS